MQKNIFETLVGLAVVIIAGLFVYHSMNSTGTSVSKKNGYLLLADFDSADGVATGSDIRIGGVKVGVVEKMELNKETFQANLSLRVNGDVKLPLDSSASIVSESLLGGKYINISPGGDEENLADGGKIEYTQSSVNFEALLGKFMFSDNKTE